MELFTKLGINPVLLLAQIINFLILLFLFKKFLYKPILGILEKRRNYILESMRKADEAVKKEKEMEKEREKKLRELRIKSEEIISKAKAAALFLHEKDARQLSKALKVKIISPKDWLPSKRTQLVAIGSNDFSVLCQKLDLPNYFEIAEIPPEEIKVY